MDPLSPLQNHSYESFPTPVPSSADAATNQEMAFIDPKRFQSSFDDAYEDLQNLANWLLRSERSSITLQSDDLVHEAFLRLTRSRHLCSGKTAELVNLIIETMRRILIDHARERQHSEWRCPFPSPVGDGVQSTLQKTKRR